MVLHLRSGPRASQDCSILPCGSHSVMRPWLDVHTWPLASAKMPITWPHLKSAGSLNHSGSDLNAGTESDCRSSAPTTAIIANAAQIVRRIMAVDMAAPAESGERKSTRLNSSHLVITYAVF